MTNQINLTPSALKWAREALNLTQAQLAEECRLREPYTTGARMIRHYESGKRPITGPVARVVELLMEREGISWRVVI